MTFLLIHPAPNLNAMAGAFTALTTSDAFGSYFNPAQLGNFGRVKNFSYQIYARKTDWLPGINQNLLLNSSALALGYNVSKIFPKVPVSIGIGRLDTKLDLGQVVFTDANGNYIGTYRLKESYTAYSAAVGIDYFIRLNIGYTIKNVRSDLPLPDSTTTKVRAEDFGLQATLPVIRAISNLTKEQFRLPGGLLPFFDISMGLTQTNKGPKVKYFDVRSDDPLPKEARIGYAVSFALQKEYSGFNLKMVKFDWASEARDLLVKYYAENKKAYSKFPGAINFWQNVLSGKSNEQITVFQGWRIKLLETFQYSKGRFKGPGFPTFQRTQGFVFSLSGLLKWLSTNYDFSVLRFAAHHFDLNYIWTKYTAKESPLNGTEFEAVSLSVFGF